jgi:hypothetical protein
MNTFEFYGVNGNSFKLNDTIWEAIEGDIKNQGVGMVDIIKKDDGSLKFSSTPLALVTIEEGAHLGHYDEYKLVDTEHSHIWLHIGTRTIHDTIPSKAIGLLFEYNEYTPESPFVCTGKLSAWLNFMEGR